jgi:iron complex outermembrane recepter protein
MRLFRSARPSVWITALASPLAATSGHSAQPAAELEDVLVVAQKRPQTYLQVPVSVSVLTSDVLDLAKVSEFQDLVQVSPSLTFSQAGDLRAGSILMRGIGTTAFQTAVEPTVSAAVDGITMGRTSQFIADLEDIDRIELLRGPQGTLFGKNATGGVIAIYTNNPTEALTGRVRASYSSDDARAVSGFISGSLREDTRGRLAFFSKSFDGWGNNAYTGNPAGGDDSWGARAKLDITLSDSVSLMLAADYAEQNRNCCALMLYDTEGPLGLLVEGEYAAYGVKVAEGNTTTLDAQDDFSNTQTWGISSEFTVALDSWRLVSLTGYRRYTLESAQGVDGRPYSGQGALVVPGIFFDSNGSYSGAGSGTPGGDHGQEQFSQEFRLESQTWARTNALLGLFYWDQAVDRYFERITVLGIGGINFGGTGWLDSTVDTESWALFGQLDHALTDSWTLTAGLRYTEDQIDVAYEKTSLNPGLLVGPGSAAASAISETGVSGKLSLQYTPDARWMTYAAVSTGYKSPGFDLIFDVTPERIAQPAPAETVISYEVGTRLEFWSNRARLGATLFHSNFDDVQGQALTDDGLDFRLTSAGSAITRGLEVDFALMPAPGWWLGIAYAYTDAFYDDYTDGPCYPAQTAAQGCLAGSQNLTDKSIANAPRNKLAIQTRYDFQTRTSWAPYLGLAYRYQSDAPGDLNDDPRTYRASYAVVDLVAGLRSSDGLWSAEVFVKNAANEFYVDRQVSIPIQGSYGAFLSRDAWRYTGIEVTYQFGVE